jgi:hypothetical protein
MPYNISAEFFQTFKEEFMSILLKLFHKIKTEETLTNSFYGAAVTLTHKPHKDSPKRELWTNFPYEHICINIQ